VIGRLRLLRRGRTGPDHDCNRDPHDTSGDDTTFHAKRMTKFNRFLRRSV